MYYVLLDEVQLLEEFEEVLNSLLHINNVDVYVTGSNSKFLSFSIIFLLYNKKCAAEATHEKRGSLAATQMSSSFLTESSMLNRACVFTKIKTHTCRKRSIKFCVVITL